ncbi:hypothetical protein AAWM_00012 [Aspergillus awamori]|uniref:Uncharacterized protein n=4 Tax=Aspergillus TaxID=5052 RepID=A0A401KCX2_ASPAW|nr:uncharacterized protein BO96DRAFT_12888 [Aspergillus niger CBS 101883]XP_035351558.1 aldo/keto reductase family protein [Aspergillus tubingensis]KAI2816259.1 hypothetical protein CBS115989_7051 [Aspergillus niger]RDK38265.1 hypothetical protein M752DRAFT_279197 [Aspergillus phoenicis ATCC 13157]GCB17127.1 hypothetical protein AAWM_00012 [Aspergillus awamori]KAI2831926.1 hypothetical protein CBS133816_1803 [Aspergillus niger]KAI2842813.1 hypothetical protein CBS11232_8413 [Aspergillus niger
MSTALSSASDFGTAVLRLSPLMISSASLMCAIDQQNAFRSFLTPKLANRPGHVSGNLVHDWFPAFARTTKWVILLAYPLAGVVAVINSRAPGINPQTRYFYYAGGVLSVAHYYFGAWSMYWNSRICSKEKIGLRNEDGLRGWLGNNWRRMWLVNIPAWLMFVCATATFVRV